MGTANPKKHPLSALRHHGTKPSTTLSFSGSIPRQATRIGRRRNDLLSFGLITFASHHSNRKAANQKERRQYSGRHIHSAYKPQTNTICNPKTKAVKPKPKKLPPTSHSKLGAQFRHLCSDHWKRFSKITVSPGAMAYPGLMVSGMMLATVREPLTEMMLIFPIV